MAREIIIEDYQFKHRIPKMSKDFGAVLNDECDVLSFTFDNHLGKGSCVGMNFDYGMSFMSIEFKTKEPITLDYRLGRRHPVSFIYVLEGEVELDNSKSQSSIKLQQSETVIYAPVGDATYQIKFPADEKVKIIICSVVRFLFLRKIDCDLDTMPISLKEMFKDTTGKKQFIFKSGSNPLNFEFKKFKIDGSKDVLEQKLLLESRTLILFTILLRNFRVKIKPYLSGYKFSIYDIQKINLAKNIILDNLKNLPTTKELSIKVGININKLQKGFNLIFGKSIRQFIISYRMHLALNLMDVTDKSISEIAQEIGYINKGHFSSLFKKEFGILPKEYRSSAKIYPLIQELKNSNTF